MAEQAELKRRGATGLRGRKKARRREEILVKAAELFSADGVEATAIADIAASVDVSPGTIYNYFGSKDGILIALITEGTKDARDQDHSGLMRTDTDFGTVIIDLFAHNSKLTLEIASRRIWRYAEAATIRHPKTKLARRYVEADEKLVILIAELLSHYEIRLINGRAADTVELATLFLDAWNATFLNLIRDEAITFEQHVDELRARLLPIIDLVFDPDFIRQPRFKANKQDRTGE